MEQDEARTKSASSKNERMNKLKAEKGVAERPQAGRSGGLVAAKEARSGQERPGAEPRRSFAEEGRSGARTKSASSKDERMNKLKAEKGVAERARSGAKRRPSRGKGGHEWPGAAEEAKSGKERPGAAKSGAEEERSRGGEEGASLDLKQADLNPALLFQAGTVSLGWAECGWALRMTTPTSIRPGYECCTSFTLAHKYQATVYFSCKGRDVPGY